MRGGLELDAGVISKAIDNHSIVVSPSNVSKRFFDSHIVGENNFSCG